MRANEKQKLVLIGNGMAGIRALEELLALAPDLYDITVFGDEPHGNYNRIMLSPVLAGEKQFADIVTHPEGWYAEHGIHLHAGRKIQQIERTHRQVIDDQGQATPYDRLLVATGSTPFILPVPGRELSGVLGFRDFQDVTRMLEQAERGGHAVVIGGGLLGLEAANGLKKRGMSVTVVHISSVLLNQQLDAPAAALLRSKLEDEGIQFLLETETEALLGDRHVQAIRFKSGLELQTELVVMAVGIRPNITLAQQAGLHCRRGIVVNDTLQTYDPRIYAIGECAEHRGTAYGLVAPLFEQAKVVANQLAQLGWAQYNGSITATKLKVTGIDLFSAGNFHDQEHTESLVFQDAARGIYKKLTLRDNRIQGAVLYGDTLDGSWYFQLMRDGADISSQRSTLLFGQAHLGNSGHGSAKVMDLPDNAEICGCNGVCKGDIVQAITVKGLFTLDDVRAHTKASASCGSCTALVEQILASTVGEGYAKTPNEKPLCKCTEHGHRTIRHAITEHNLKTIPEVMHFLEWKTPDGCHSCRPALNYYLLCAWPDEYQDDLQSRFINERAHGNIQKDGSFSVVPRMWGGLTNPQELRAIADVAEKFKVPEIKVTGGQRIDLFGVQKEDLPAVWADLSAAGFVSGHAYGKALRTVKTCVGSHWCRFGTQDSTGLGVKLEKLTWGSWMPHKFKLAVSGCPRNCAEATIKDFGIVCVDSGYELHIGGNGGVKVRVTDLLTRVETEAEVLEMTAAFTQYYREDAHYLERTAPWVERIGVEAIRSRLLDPEQRSVLAARFRHSQETAQHDPWEARAHGAEQHEFTPMREAATA